MISLAPWLTRAVPPIGAEVLSGSYASSSVPNRMFCSRRVWATLRPRQIDDLRVKLGGRPAANAAMRSAGNSGSIRARSCGGPGNAAAGQDGDQLGSGDTRLLAVLVIFVAMSRTGAPPEARQAATR